MAVGSIPQRPSVAAGSTPLAGCIPAGAADSIPAVVGASAAGVAFMAVAGTSAGGASYSRDGVGSTVFRPDPVDQVLARRLGLAERRRCIKSPDAELPGDGDRET